MLKRSFFMLGLILSSCSHSSRVSPLEITPYPIEKELAQVNPKLVKEGSIESDWWQLFQDEQLSTFIERGLTYNPNFQTAQQKILYAASLAAMSKSNLYPTINYGADILREKFSQTGIIPFSSIDGTTSPNIPPGAGPAIAAPGGVAGIPVYFTQYENEFSLAYDFDLWNKNKNTWKAAVAEKNAAMADTLFARLELSIAIAKAYYALQIDLKRKNILRELVGTREKYVHLFEKRVKGHLNDVLTLKNFEINLAELKQRNLQIDQEIALKEHQLKAYLSGDFTEVIEKLEIKEKDLPQVPIATHLPLNLLARRPDITSQLWMIESAGKQIEVAKAGFYPDLDITALFGYQTLDFSKFFQWPSSFFNVNPALNLPIFTGGNLQATFFQSEVNYDLAILKYNDLVIQAVKEVLDGLTLLENTKKQWEVTENILEDQKQLLELSKLRVKHHLDSILEEWERKITVLEAEEKEVMALGERVVAILTLIKALGGGYEGCYLEGAI